MKSAITETIDQTWEIALPAGTRDVFPDNLGFPEPTIGAEKATWTGVAESEAARRFEKRAVEISPLVRKHRMQTPRRQFRLLQHWECVVSEVTENSVWANIVDLTDRSRPEEVVELPLEDFVEADRHLLAEGCVFYWAIGYQKSKAGQISRISEIRVRRTPKWSANAVKRLKAEARRMLEQFEVHAQNDSSST